MAIILYFICRIPAIFLWIVIGSSPFSIFYSPFSILNSSPFSIFYSPFVILHLYSGVVNCDSKFSINGEWRLKNGECRMETVIVTGPKDRIAGQGGRHVRVEDNCFAAICNEIEMHNIICHCHFVDRSINYLFILFSSATCYVYVLYLQYYYPPIYLSSYKVKIYILINCFFRIVCFKNPILVQNRLTENIVLYRCTFIIFVKIINLFFRIPFAQSWRTNSKT